MEDLQPISEAEQASFCVELMKRLNMQRGQDYLCDITLVAKEGNEFKAHRNVLSAVSPFFDKLFQSEMKEKEEGIIRFEEISTSILEGVLEFIYTGHVEIHDEQSAKELIIAADFLLLDCLKTFAGRFLEKLLTNANCISTFYFAETYQCEELVAKTRKFVHDNFASVAELDEFLDLEAEEVDKWISSDEICVEAEEDIFKIIQKWIEQKESDRKSKFEELFRHVRLVFVSLNFLVLDIASNELVRDNYSCLTKVRDAIALVGCESKDPFLESPELPRRRLGSHAIVACGGKDVYCYLPGKDEWNLMAYDGHESVNEVTPMVVLRDNLFIFAGFDRKPKQYYPFFNSLSSVRHLQWFNRYTQVAVVRGQIYAIDRTRHKSTIQRYSVGTCSWERIFTSHEGCRDHSCVVAAGDCMYVLGGELLQREREFVAKAERFDTVQNKWEEIADMQQERGYACGVATQGKIFVAGGCGKGGKTSKCEVYNISTNEWQFIGSLRVPRFFGSMVCVNGALYVLGGSRYLYSTSPLYTVESYNPTTNEWIQKTSIPMRRISVGVKKPGPFKGCTLKLSKGMLAVNLNELIR